MAKFVYAFTKDAVAICPKDHWEQEGDIYPGDMPTLLPFVTENDLQQDDLAKALFTWPEKTNVADIAKALHDSDMFEGDSTLMSFLNGDKTEHVTEAKVEPTPDPVAPPSLEQTLPVLRDSMKILIGNHTIEIPMDVNTAMMLAQVLQTYAQYQILQGARQSVPLQSVSAPKPASKPEKPKPTAPQTPSDTVFSLPNSMQGEALDVHGKTVIKIRQNGMVLVETKACDKREEAHDIAIRFARMIPGMTKPGEIIRK